MDWPSPAGLVCSSIFASKNGTALVRNPFPHVSFQSSVSLVSLIWSISVCHYFAQLYQRERATIFDQSIWLLSIIKYDSWSFSSLRKIKQQFLHHLVYFQFDRLKSTIYNSKVWNVLAWRFKKFYNFNN